MFKTLLSWKHAKTKVMVPEPVMEDGNILEENYELLEACPICSRTFLPTALKKHQPICRKNATKKRKVFDSLKQRVEGTDLAPFHQKTYLKHTASPSVDSTSPLATKAPPSPLTSTNNQHQSLSPHTPTIAMTHNSHSNSSSEFAPTIRSLKPVRIESKTVRTTAPQSQNKRCPHCDRNFGPKAFDRHVQWCEEHQTRLQTQNMSLTFQLAKERLEARTKYKVPQMGRGGKRITTIREKYATPSGGKYKRPTTKKSPATDSKPSTKSRSSILSATSTVSLEYDPYESAERQFLELLNGEDNDKVEDRLKTRQLSLTSLSQRPYGSATIDTVTSNLDITNNNSVKLISKEPVKSASITNIQSTNNNRTSIIEPPMNFQDHLIHYNTGNMNSDNCNRQHVIDNNHLSLPLDETLLLSMGSSTLLINAHDNLTLPKLPSSIMDSKQTKKKSNTSITSKSSKTAVPSETTAVSVPFTADDLFNVDDEMYAEYKQFEELYLKEKQQATVRLRKNRSRATTNSGSSSLNSNYMTFGVPPPLMLGATSNGYPDGDGSALSTNNKVGGGSNCNDSAYNSLNRPSLESGGGSVDGSTNSSEVGSGVVVACVLKTSQSKFCHECGSKYPVDHAKFCVECGIKRLIL